MNSFNQSIETKRFLRIIDKLIGEEKIKSDSAFCKAAEFSAQSFSQMRREKRDVTIDLISTVVNKYEGNPIFIFTGKGTLILNEAVATNTLLASSKETISTAGSDSMLNELRIENERLKKLMDYYFRQGELTINYTKLLEEQNKELLKELGGVKK